MIVSVGLLVVGRRTDGAGHEGVGAVGADHDGGALLDGGAGGVAAPDADHPAVVPEQLLDGEALAHLGARLGGGVGEQRVDDGAADADGLAGAVDRCGLALEHDGPEVEAHGVEERRAGGPDAVEQAPPRQPGGAGGLDRVAGQDVARERGPVDDEHPAASAGEEHGGGGAGAAAPDDDGVVHGASFGRVDEHDASSAHRPRLPSAVTYGITPGATT